MELDQLVFGKITSWLGRKRHKPSAEFLATRVTLEEVRDKCTIIARALTGLPVECIEGEDIGGWKDVQFLLPGQCGHFNQKQSNHDFYIFRTLYMSELLQLYRASNAKQDSFVISNESKLHRTIVDSINDKYPGFDGVYESMRQELTSKELKLDILSGKWIKPSQSIQELFSPDANHELDEEEKESKEITEVKAKAVDEVKSVAVDREKQEEYMLTHNFEKVETLEEFNGNWRDFDGDDDLQQHAEALEQVKMNMTVRVNDKTHSVYQSDLRFNSDIPESATIDIKSGQKFTYAEWDYKSQSSKPDFCTLYEHSPRRTDQDYVSNTICQNGVLLRNIKRNFNQFYNDLTAVKRLEQGEELNLDDFSDYRMGLKISKENDERIYKSKRKRKRNISFLFLLDLSMSADSYVNGTKILDIEKQVSILLGEVLNEHSIDFQVDGFFSETRNQCSYLRLKGFNDKWERSRARIAGVQAQGYTRIGPAIRHATQFLNKSDAKNKWLVLLSDGKPNDYDKYEGTYGVKDVRKAIREASACNINLHTFAVEEKAKFYLPQIFGPNNYNVLKNPAELISSIAEFCQKVMRS